MYDDNFRFLARLGATTFVLALGIALFTKGPALMASVMVDLVGAKQTQDQPHDAASPDTGDAGTALGIVAAVLVVLVALIVITRTIIEKISNRRERERRWAGVIDQWNMLRGEVGVHTATDPNLIMKYPQLSDTTIPTVAEFWSTFAEFDARMYEHATAPVTEDAVTEAEEAAAAAASAWTAVIQRPTDDCTERAASDAPRQAIRSLMTPTARRLWPDPSRTMSVTRGIIMSDDRTVRQPTTGAHAQPARDAGARGSRDRRRTSNVGH